MKPLMWVAPAMFISSVFIGAQAADKKPLKEQSLFGAEDETVDHPVKVSDGALEVLRKDEWVLQFLKMENKSPDQLTGESFLASGIHLDGPKETDLIVTGIGRLRGNVATFWVFRNLPEGPQLVLKATAQSLLVQSARRKGFRNISAASPIAGYSVEKFFRFDGKKYQQFRTKSGLIK